MLSLDVMDISGEGQADVTHNIYKTRLGEDGRSIETEKQEQLKGEVARAASGKDPNYCGSCYGGTPAESGSVGSQLDIRRDTDPRSCCNTCDEVKEAYTRKGWSFSNPNGIEQCVNEGWVDKMKDQNMEGCRLAGEVRVNKVC